MACANDDAASTENAVRFSFNREPIDIKHVYKWQPHVYDGLSFSFPQKARYSRTVKTSDNWYELWTPNSDRVDFYPGTSPEDEVLPAWSQDPFADGRMGPHDWSLHPQHFTVVAPWLGFCRRPRGYLRSWRDVDPELVPLPLIWLSSLTHPGYGKLYHKYSELLQTRAEFLGRSVAQFRYVGKVGDQDDERLDRVLCHRPDYPSPNDVSTIVQDRYWKWEELVDLYTAVQRGLREMEAWLTMMQYWGERTQTTSSDPPLPLKENNRMGVWLNGAPEVDGLWLLRIDVIPIYIIHQYIEDADFPKERPEVLDRRPKDHRCHPDFMSGTFAELINSMTNPYLDVFFTYSSGKTFRPIYRQGMHRAEADMLSRLRSASWAADVHVSLDQETDGVRGGLACSIGSARPTSHEESISMAPTSSASLDKTSTTTNTNRRADDSGGVGELLVSHPSSTSLSLDKMSTEIDAGDRLESTSDVVMSDISDASVRDFEIVPELRCSPYIYLICGIEQSITLRDHLTAICDEHHSYSGIRSIHQDPLAVRDSTHTGFVVEFESSARSAIVVKFLDNSNCGSWVYIAADRAAQIVTEATDRWLAPPAGFTRFFSQPSKDSLPSSPNREVRPFHSQQPPSRKLAFSNQSAKWTRLGPSVRHNPVGTSPHRQTSERPIATLSPHPESSTLGHRKTRRGKRKRHGGKQAALLQKFARVAMDFYELIAEMSDEDFASCTPEQQSYILKKKAELANHAIVDNDLQDAEDGID